MTVGDTQTQDLKGTRMERVTIRRHVVTAAVAWVTFCVAAAVVLVFEDRYD